MSNFEELAASIEAKLDEVAKDRAASDKARDEKLAALGKQQTELARDFAALEQKMAGKAAPVAAKDMSLGAQVVGNESIKAFLSGAVRSARVLVNTADLAASSPVLAPTMQQHIPGIVGAGFPPHEVEAAFPHVTISGNSVDFLKAGAETNSAAPVAEGSSKPESAFEILSATAPVRTIAHFVRISKQLAEDAQAVASYINARMAYGLEAKVEAQLIAGNGTGQNLSGLFLAGNCQLHGLTDPTLTPLDVIRKCALKVRLNGFAPTCVFLNPSDYDDIIGLKDEEGRYLIANPTAANTQNLWGLRPVQSTAITAGTAIVGDPYNGATIFDRTQAEIAMFEQDADNVTKNLITIRAERRLAFAVENVACFVGGDLVITE